MRKVCAAVMAAVGFFVFSMTGGSALANDGDTADSAATQASHAGSLLGDLFGASGDDTALTGPYAKLITRYADKYKVEPELADAVVRIESHYDAKARGRAGEIGLMQIKPATARLMGYTGSIHGLYKPSVNLKYGMMYLAEAQNLGDGSVCGTILKYNAGHGAKKMNPISQRYCQKVIAALD